MPDVQLKVKKASGCLFVCGLIQLSLFPLPMEKMIVLVTILQLDYTICAGQGAEKKKSLTKARLNI